MIGQEIPSPPRIAVMSRLPYRFWLSLLFIALTSACFASVQSSTPLRNSTLGDRERQTWKVPLRMTEFDEIPHVSQRRRCEDTQPPESLATPNPLSILPDGNAKVKVSFIIGTDGLVHSPLILESGGRVRDRNVLRAVRTWRYRPATCNGVPTEAEGKIEFRSVENYRVR